MALIDEADSVLVDEGLVPLVLAGAADGEEAGPDMADVVRGLRPGRDYQVDEDGRNVSLTTAGTRAAEAALGGVDLYADQHLATLTRVNLALHAAGAAEPRRRLPRHRRPGPAHQRSRGRVARLQRWPDGLHAAVEAKEGLTASRSGEILDSITIGSLVGRYATVCGMTGTAVAVGEQLREFFGLEIAVIPPNRPCVRADEPDRLYVTARQKEQALAEHAAAVHAAGRPVLIGTLDVAQSERIAAALGAAGLSATVLNAKNDAEEAAIVARAGTRAAITVSTQMAGRGTDIRLGGPAGDQGEIAALGGLHVIGAGRHGSSRLDHQLRGRAGRQGDPGSSVFFASMEDDLVTRYAPDARPPAGAGADGRTADAAAQAAVAHAQRVAEGVSLEIYRNTVRYNHLIGVQRQIVLDQRDRVLRTDAARRALARRHPGRDRDLAGVASDEVLTTRPGRSPCGTWTGAGRITSVTWPTCGRASTCARWAAGSARWTSSTSEAVRVFGGLLAQRGGAGRGQLRDRAGHRRRGRPERGRPEAPVRHLDLPRPGQPVRHRHRPGAAQRGPRAAGTAARLRAAGPAARLSVINRPLTCAFTSCNRLTCNRLT